jgi:hypothetical protein
MLPHPRTPQPNNWEMFQLSRESYPEGTNTAQGGNTWPNPDRLCAAADWQRPW